VTVIEDNTYCNMYRVSMGTRKLESYNSDCHSAATCTECPWENKCSYDGPPGKKISYDSPLEKENFLRRFSGKKKISYDGPPGKENFLLRYSGKKKYYDSPPGKENFLRESSGKRKILTRVLREKKNSYESPPGKEKFLRESSGKRKILMTVFWEEKSSCPGRGLFLSRIRGKKNSCPR